MLPLLVLLLAGATEHCEYIAERVDLIEVNHFHDENGKLVFDQVIFYDWSPFEGHFHVRAWRLLKNNEQIPAKNYKTGLYVVIWHDGDYLRKVTAPACYETWTQHDPELAEREFLPKEQRLDFIKPIAKVPPAPTINMPPERTPANSLPTFRIPPPPVPNWLPLLP